MTGCGERTGSAGGLVDRALVRVAIVDVILDFGYYPDGAHLRVEYLRHRLFEGLFLVVPSAAFDEETIDVDAIFCTLRQIEFGLVRDYLEVKVDCVDGNDVFSGKVLLGASQEGLCEIETRYPVNRWLTIINPILDELQPCQEILNPGCQWLE